MNIIDQKAHWNKIHNEGGLEDYSHSPTSFAEEIVKFVPLHGKLLELGCGLGNDSSYFSQQGFEVIGTDFSETAIEQNSSRYFGQSLLSFKVLDISQHFPFNDSEFDVVYARLSLHYFNDVITRHVFSEICRVLKYSGYLCFVCKSVEDPLYGKGDLIEKDMYNLNGHVRHFFNESYVRECLGDRYKFVLLNSGKESFYGSESGYVKVIAQKI